MRQGLDSLVGDLVDEKSGSYYAGSWVPDIVAAVVAPTAIVEEGIPLKGSGELRIGPGYIKSGATQMRYRIAIGGRRSLVHGHIHGENWYKPWGYFQKIGPWKRYD
jgi:hypothetical protein